MNYTKIYINLIEKSKNVDKCDGEIHHIIPRSIFDQEYIHNKLFDISTNDCEGDDNKVRLSIREHYIAHALLVRICSDNKNCYIKMHHAFNIMRNRGGSRSYELYKKQYCFILSEIMVGKPSRALGCKWSDESRRNRKDNHWMTGKTYEELYGYDKAKELRNNRSITSKNRIVSDETKKMLSDRVFTEEWRRKISEAHKGKVLSEDHKNKISSYLSNPDKNPSVDQTIYRFYHKDGRIIDARRYDMKKMYGCKSIHKVISGVRGHCGGWMYRGEIIESEGDI